MDVCMLQVMEATTTRKAYACDADGCMHAPSCGGSHHQKSFMRVMQTNVCMLQVMEATTTRKALCVWCRWMYACSKLWRQPPPEKLMRVMQMNVCMLQVMEAATTRKAYACDADGCMHAPSYGGSHHQKSLCVWCRWMYACSKLWRQPPPEKLMRVMQMDVCMLQVMEAATTRKYELHKHLLTSSLQEWECFSNSRWDTSTFKDKVKTLNCSFVLVYFVLIYFATCSFVLVCSFTLVFFAIFNLQVTAQFPGALYPVGNETKP